MTTDATSSAASCNNLRDAVCALGRELRREQHRRHKSATDHLDRMHQPVWVTSGVLMRLHPSTRTPARMFVLWRLKRRVGIYRADRIGLVTADAIDARIDHTMAGPLAAVINETAANPNARIHFLAARWLAEFNTFIWLVQTNVSGASPSSRDIFERFQRYMPSTSTGVVYSRWVQRIEAATRQENTWAITYRKRWQISFSQLPQSTQLSDAQLSQRVFGRESSPPGFTWRSEHVSAACRTDTGG